MTTSAHASRETALATVTRYLAAIQDGTPAEIAALYRPDGTLEDPAGSSPVTGHEAIAAFYAPLARTKQETELLTFRHSGPATAFLFTVRTVMPDGTTIEISPIDVMRIDADGLIVSMTALWSSEDVRS